MHEVLVNRLGGLRLPRKSVVRLTDRPDMTLDVYRGRKTTIQYNTTYTVRIPICVQNSDRHAGPASKLKVWSTRGFVLVAGFSIIEMDIAERKDGDYSNFRFFMCKLCK